MTEALGGTQEPENRRPRRPRWSEAVLVRWLPRDPLRPTRLIHGLSYLVLVIGALLLVVAGFHPTADDKWSYTNSSAIDEVEYIRPESEVATIPAFTTTNPFSPQRRPPSVSFAQRLDAPPVTEDPTPPQPVTTVRLAGTGLVPRGRSFAVLQQDGMPSRLVREGEVWAGLKLLRVTANGATVETDSGAIELRLPGSP